LQRNEKDYGEKEKGLPVENLHIVKNNLRNEETEKVSHVTQEER